MSQFSIGILDQTGNPYASWSSTNKSSNIALSNNNLTFRGGTGGTSGKGTGIATIGKSSGKWYWEVTINTPSSTALGGLVGACNWVPVSGNVINTWETAQGMGFCNAVPLSIALAYNLTGSTVFNGSSPVLVNNDVVSFALDLESATKNIRMFKNGVQVGITLTGITGTWYPACMSQGTVITSGATANFGQNPWSLNSTVASTRNALFLIGYNQGVYN